MINPQLLDFIKQQLQKGFSKEIITKELLANEWTAQDVEEGFKAVGVPIINLNNASIPPSFNNINLSTSSIQTKNHSGLKIFLIIIIIFIFAGGAFAYYFRDNLKNIPIINQFIQKEVQTVNDNLVIDENLIVNENPKKETSDDVVNPYISCDSLVNKSKEKDACYFENSNSDKLTNINQCDLIKEDAGNNSYYKEFCYNMLAMNLKNIEVCSLMKNIEHKKECYNYLKNTTGISCDSMNDKINKDECIQLTTIIKNNLPETSKKTIECNAKNSLSDSESLMGAEKKSWECFTDNLKKCEPATIFGSYSTRIQSPKQLVSYKIVGKNGALCEVSGPLFNMMSGKVSETNCKLDSLILDKYYKEQKENYAKSYFLANNVVSGYGTKEHTKYCID